MRTSLYFDLDNIADFKSKIITWANKFSPIAFFDSNFEKDYNLFPNLYPDNDFILAVKSTKDIKICASDAFEKLHKFHTENKDWLFGHLAYDLKNDIEKLNSENFDALHFPDMFFFIPELIFIHKKGKLQILFHDNYYNTDEISNIFEEIINTDTSNKYEGSKKNILKARISKSKYLQEIYKILSHIQKGDIFELNYCQEFFGTEQEFSPLPTFLRIKEISPTPFSCYYKFDDKYLLSASPERYLRKTGNRIISQPIKGTIRRGKNKEEDLQLLNQLQNDPKERSENIMIVDLVRNDLARTAKRGSVKVEELCEIYSYPQVHQMISTINSELSPEFSFADLLKSTFPMGSMTGAPKVRAMKLIEQYEATKRGIYSGAVGYIKPNANFDFNVVIRSIVYNKRTKYLSYIVGSAITCLSVPEKEYEECLIKAEAMKKALQ